MKNMKARRKTSCWCIILLLKLEREGNWRENIEVTEELERGGMLNSTLWRGILLTIIK